MASSVNIRKYKQRQKPFVAGRQTMSQYGKIFSLDRIRFLTGVSAAAIIVGSLITYGIHGRIVHSMERVQQLRVKNAAVANENVHLLAARAQLASKTHVLALAEKKLKLFEPEKGQVHRM